MDADIKKLIPILLENREKPFVKRILSPDNYPTLDNKDGSYSTHSMAWGNADNKNIVFPTVIYDEPAKTMRRLGEKEAFDRAMKIGENIKFDIKEDADWFSKNYKKYWDASGHKY